MSTSHSGGDDAARAGLRFPERLVSATRADWRERLGVLADEAIERAARDGRGQIALDLRDTTEVDASGLGFVVAVRQRAVDRGLAVRLTGVAPAIRALLAATKVDALFLLDQ